MKEEIKSRVFDKYDLQLRICKFLLNMLNDDVDTNDWDMTLIFRSTQWIKCWIIHTPGGWYLLVRLW